MRTEAPWWSPPLLAVQLLTRLPVPLLKTLHSEQVAGALGRATAWLPLAGAAVGAFTAAIFVGCSGFWAVWIAAPLALACEAWLTGAFHEDAVADFCDAFGGGRSANEIQRILKDSRIGSFGTTGLFLALAMRAGAIAALPPPLVWPAMIGAASFGRLCAVLVLFTAPPVSRQGLAKSAGRPLNRTLFVAIAATAPPLAWLALASPIRLAAAIFATCIFLWWLTRLLHRRLGGSTGDCLGFAAYAGQLFVLLACCAR